MEMKLSFGFACVQFMNTIHHTRLLDGDLISGAILMFLFAVLALGGLVAIRGMRYWARVTAFTVVLGGGLTWLMAGGSNHIGASGVVFGYLGAVLGAAVFERRPKALAPAFLAVGFYSGMLAGLVPQEFISWEGHLFGLIAGILAARWMTEPRRPRGASTDNVQAWELDEPWFD